MSSPVIAPVSSCRPVRLWVLEHNASIEQLLVEHLNRVYHFCVVGSSGCEDTMLEACRKGGVDVVLMDLYLGPKSGLKVLAALGRLAVRPRVVIFSAVSAAHTVQAALKWGVEGYVERAGPLGNLKQAIERVAQGRVYLGQKISLVARSLFERHSEATLRSAVFTSREALIVELTARGWATCKIAQKLALSESSVYKSKASIRRKINASNDQGITLAALQLGLVGLDDLAGQL